MQISIVEPDQSTLFISDNIIQTLEFSEVLSDRNLINTDPLFQDPEASNYQLDQASPAIDAGPDINVPMDLLGKPRDETPDLGAYEKHD